MIRKHITFLLMVCSALILVSGCSTETGAQTATISDVVSISQLDTVLDNPLVLVDTYSQLKGKKLDLTKSMTGWEELEGDHFFNYYGHSNENGNAMITIGRKNQMIIGIDVSDVTDNPTPEKSLERFIHAYSVLSDSLGEPQIHNVDTVYSSDANIPTLQLESYLDKHDCTHGYYVEWAMQGGDYIGIDFTGTNTSNSHVTYRLYYDD